MFVCKLEGAKAKRDVEKKGKLIAESLGRKEGKKCSHRNGKTLTIIETESREKHTENL